MRNEMRLLKTRLENDRSRDRGYFAGGFDVAGDRRE